MSGPLLQVVACDLCGSDYWRAVDPNALLTDADVPRICPACDAGIVQ